jgi:hypothetical protein
MILNILKNPDLEVITKSKNLCYVPVGQNSISMVAS